MSPIKIIISFKNWGNSWIIIIHMQHLPLMASIIQTYNRSITTITLIINIIVVETLSNYADCQQIIYVTTCPLSGSLSHSDSDKSEPTAPQQKMRRRSHADIKG